MFSWMQLSSGELRGLPMTRSLELLAPPHPFFHLFVVGVSEHLHLTGGYLPYPPASHSNYMHMGMFYPGTYGPKLSSSSCFLIWYYFHCCFLCANQYPTMSYYMLQQAIYLLFYVVSGHTQPFRVMFFMVTNFGLQL